VRHLFLIGPQSALNVVGGKEVMTVTHTMLLFTIELSAIIVLAALVKAALLVRFLLPR